jgi:hypothetical protein
MDLAKANIQRSLHSLEGVGCVQYDSDNDRFYVGPLLTEDIENLYPANFPGPWSNAAGKYEFQFDFILELIQTGELYVFEREKCFIVHSWMKEVLMAYPPYNVEDEPTYVVHEDSNGGHILVDEEGRITGLIDWER